MTGLVEMLTGRPERGESLDSFLARTLLDPSITKRGSILPIGKTEEGEVEFAAPEIALDLVKAFLLPSHAYEGGSYEPEDATNAALELAGGGLLTSKAVPNAVPKGALGIFAGPSAKTADKAALKTAQGMAEAGADRADIWKNTGWFKDVDGKWKFEIDDSQAKHLREFDPNFHNVVAREKGYEQYVDIPMEKRKPINLEVIGRESGWREADKLGQPMSEHLAHGPLKQGYEDLMEIKTFKDPSMMEYKGAYNPKNKSIRYGGGVIGRDDEDKSTLLHELQHAIQGREGFAKGGNVEQFRAPQGRAAARVKFLNDEMARAAKELDEVTSGYNQPKAGMEKRHAELRNQYDSAMKEKLELWEESTKDPFEQYKRLAGEAEARNVQTRMDFTPEQRRTMPPWATLDVPEEDLLVRMLQEGPAAATVYHGSPHKFDKFDMSKIGTGEGVQAYGHGLYFADNPTVAKQYRDQLTRHNTPHQSRVTMEIEAAQRDLPTYREMLADKSKRPSYSDGSIATDRWVQNRIDEASETITKGGEWLKDAGGKLYEVDLPDDSIAKMLDWDKPLSEQPEGVREALADKMPDYKVDRFGYIKSADRLVEKSPGDELTGRDIYNLLKMQSGEDDLRKALKHGTHNLVERGIPGIKYLDQGSRAGGQGTYNYVVFDDTLPKILRRR